MHGNVSAGDRGRARATVGLQYVAINVNRALAQQRKVHRSPQRATDQALDFLRASALLATCGLALTAWCVARGNTA